MKNRLNSHPVIVPVQIGSEPLAPDGVFTLLVNGGCNDESQVAVGNLRDSHAVQAACGDFVANRSFASMEGSDVVSEVIRMLTTRRRTLRVQIPPESLAIAAMVRFCAYRGGETARETSIAMGSLGGGSTDDTAMCAELVRRRDSVPDVGSSPAVATFDRRLPGAFPVGSVAWGHPGCRVPNHLHGGTTCQILHHQVAAELVSSDCCK